MRSLSIIPLLIIPFLGLVAASGCTKQAADQPITDTVKLITDTVTKSYLALGDSYTIGEAVNANERFPAQTVTLLGTHGIQVAEPQYIARTGWTTANLQNAISNTNLKSSYTLVSLLIGVNDQYQGLDTSGYRIRFTQLLQKALQLSGNRPTHVFVLSIPDYSVTPFGGGSAKISEEIEAFNQINKEITMASHTTYIDITLISREAANDASLIAGDGLHPSGKQYQRWAEKLAKAMLPVVK